LKVETDQPAILQEDIITVPTDVGQLIAASEVTSTR